MKIKRIMLITFLLLAVLAIGAVSAADDVASDNMMRMSSQLTMKMTSIMASR